MIQKTGCARLQRTAFPKNQPISQSKGGNYVTQKERAGQQRKLEKHMMQRELIVKIAKMYYYDEMSQQEIANELDISRSNVSRILKLSRDMNIVDIRINDSSVRSFEVCKRLKEKFALKEVVIAPSNTDSEVNISNIGFHAARYFETVLKDNMNIGITWGRSIHHMISSLMPTVRTNIKVVQMMGGTNWSDAYKYGVQLIFSFAEKIGGQAKLINAPLMLGDRQLRDLLLQEKSIREHLDVARRVDVALLGVGTNDMSLSTMVLANSISPEESRLLWDSGIIAHICGRPINQSGEISGNAFNDRVLGVELEDLKRIPHVIGVAGGPSKVLPILASLRGGHINTLITDEKTAVLVDKHSEHA